MNFNELIETAKQTAGRRGKAFTDLKREAPEILRQYAETMKSIGYSGSNFKGKLFHDQCEFRCYSSHKKEAWLYFDFNEMKLIEATDEERTSDGEFQNVYDGKEYDLNFTENTHGPSLLQMLETLPARIAACIEKSERQSERAERILIK